MADPIRNSVTVLDNGDVLSGEEVFKCGQPLTDKFVYWMSRLGELTTDESVFYHRAAMRLNG